MQEKTGGLIKGLIKRIRRFSEFIEILGILWSKERRYSARLGFFKKLRAWRLGFLSDSYVQYFPTGDDSTHKEFLSDFQRWYYVPRINAKYGIVLADKLLFHKIFDQYHEHIPKIYYLIKDSKLYSTDFIQHENSELVDLLKEKQQLILKPRIGFGGRGIVKATYLKNQFLVGNKILSSDEFILYALNLDNYIVCQFIQQDGYANEIYPESVNTLRILTVIDPITQHARLASVAHRFGSSTTGHVDNWTSGGLSADVDCNLGILGRCARNPQGRDLIWLSNHPDTNVAISGRVIPNWATVRARILAMAEFYKFCPYIGWDVAVTDKSFWIIEANDSPDVHILQIHTPLFRSIQNLKFYRFNKVVD
jgi:hypothetical protein